MKVNPSGIVSFITTLVAFALAVLFTVIMNLTKVLLPTTVTLAVLLIVKLIGTTSTVTLDSITVLFSLLVMFTQLLTVSVVLVLTTIHNSIADLLVILAISQPTNTRPSIWVSLKPTKPVTLLPTETKVRPAGNKSRTTTPVALTTEVLFTIIVKLTRVLFPTTVTLASLVILTMTGTTSTVALDLVTVLFSLLVTLTQLVKLPVALVLAVITNSTAVLFTKLVIFQLITVLPSAKTTSAFLIALLLFVLIDSTIKPLGKISLITTSVALTTEVLFTIIVNLTKVLLPTTITLAVLLTVKLTGTILTVTLDSTTVSFSLLVTLTQLLTASVVLVLTTIHNLIAELFVKLVIFQPTNTRPLVWVSLKPTKPVTLLPTETKVRPAGNKSRTTTPVALTTEVLFTIIVKLTRVLLPTTVTLAVLLIVKLTGTTFTVTLSYNSSFPSGYVTLTSLVKLPTALVLATIQYVILSPDPR